MICRYPMWMDSADAYIGTQKSEGSLLVTHTIVSASKQSSPRLRKSNTSKTSQLMQYRQHLCNICRCQGRYYKPTSVLSLLSLTAIMGNLSDFGTSRISVKYTLFDKMSCMSCRNVRHRIRSCPLLVLLRGTTRLADNYAAK